MSWRHLSHSAIPSHKKPWVSGILVYPLLLLTFWVSQVPVMPHHWQLDTISHNTRAPQYLKSWVTKCIIWICDHEFLLWNHRLIHVHEEYCENCRLHTWIHIWPQNIFWTMKSCMNEFFIRSDVWILYLKSYMNSCSRGILWNHAWILYWNHTSFLFHEEYHGWINKWVHIWMLNSAIWNQY